MIENESQCKTCREEVCIFLQFEADVANLKGWNARAAALDTNRDRRKYAFRTFCRWSGMMGGGREQLPNCVEFGVRSWFPDRAYMGFHADNDHSARVRAVNANGVYIDLWWVYRDVGWVLDDE